MDQRSLLMKSISCKGIKCFNLFQKPSYYAVMSIGRLGDRPKERRKQKTPVSHDGGENPEWDVAIRFDLGEGSFQDMYLEFDVKVQGNLFHLGNKLAGRARVPFTDLTPENGAGNATHVSYQVLSPDGKPNGVISFSYVLNSLETGVGQSPPMQESAVLKPYMRDDRPLPSAPTASDYHEQQRQDPSQLLPPPQMADSYSLNRPPPRNPDIHYPPPPDFPSQTRALIPDHSFDYPKSSPPPPSPPPGFYPTVDQQPYTQVFPGTASPSIAPPYQQSGTTAYGFPSPQNSISYMNVDKSAAAAAPYPPPSAAYGFPSLQDSISYTDAGRSAANARPCAPPSAAYGFPPPLVSVPYRDAGNSTAVAAPNAPPSAAYGFPTPLDSCWCRDEGSSAAIAAGCPASCAAYGFPAAQVSFWGTDGSKSAAVAAPYPPSSAAHGLPSAQGSWRYVGDGQHFGFPPPQGSCCCIEEERSHHGYGYC